MCYTVFNKVLVFEIITLFIYRCTRSDTGETRVSLCVRSGGSDLFPWHFQRCRSRVMATEIVHSLSQTRRRRNRFHLSEQNCKKKISKKAIEKPRRLYAGAYTVKKYIGGMGCMEFPSSKTKIKWLFLKKKKN